MVFLPREDDLIVALKRSNLFITLKDGVGLKGVFSSGTLTNFTLLTHKVADEISFSTGVLVTSLEGIDDLLGSFSVGEEPAIDNSRGMLLCSRTLVLS